MRPPANAITQSQLARAYAVTRQRVGQLVQQHGFEVVADPDRLFAARLDHCRGPLRSKLSDPEIRAQIKLDLQQP